VREGIYSAFRSEGGESVEEVNEMVCGVSKEFGQLEIEKEFDACIDQIGI
jgi:hypothetical protein